MSLQIGYAQQIITPSLDRPVYLAGFGKNRVAKSVHDDLYARALALSDGRTTLVLCALDLIGFFRADASEIADRVQAWIPGTRVIIASTHNHHGPDTLGLWGPDDRTSGVDPAYLGGLKEKITRAIREALQLNLGVADVKSSSVPVPGAAKNTRDPEIVDDELTCLQFLGEDGRPLVTVMIFSCHPQVMWVHNPHITSDYPGLLRREVEAATRSPCLFFSGALGCMMPPDVIASTFEEFEALGMPLTEKGLASLETAGSQPPPALGAEHSEFPVELTNIVFKTAMSRGLLPEMRDSRGRLTCEANLIQVGDCWLVTVPGELLPKLGLQTKARLKRAGARVPGVIGLANDALGYIVPGEDFHSPGNPLQPDDHFEEAMSIGRQFGPRLMEAIEKMVRRNQATEN